MNKNSFLMDVLYASTAYLTPDFVAEKHQNLELTIVHKKLEKIIKNDVFTGIPDFNEPINGMMATYKNGWYSCGPASCFIGLHHHTLRIAFTGTNELGDVKNYLNFKREYDLYKPIIHKFINYAREHNLYVRATGHSLGGAMVEYFMKEMQPYQKDISIKGITFGSPGTAIKEKIPAITNFIHSDDIVPKIGRIIYSQHGRNILIEKPKHAFIASHLSEEYVASLSYLTKRGIHFDELHPVKIDNNLFDPLDLRSQAASIHIPKSRFYPLYNKFTQMMSEMKDKVLDKVAYSTLKEEHHTSIP